MSEQSHVVRGEVDGVPAFWPSEPQDGPAPLLASLGFRTGFADETLPTHGLTHLLEHLALHPLDDRRRSFDGRVGALQTDFVTEGTPEEVAAFLLGLTRSLHDLPLERVETEKRVLRTEADGRGTSFHARLMNFRYGPRGHGLPYWQELGLGWVGAEELTRWAAERFTRGNCVLVLSGPPPDGLRLALPDGPRLPRPEAEPIPELQHPCFVADGTGGVAVSGAPPWSPALLAGLAVARDRVRDRLRIDEGLSYGTSSEAFVLDGRTSAALLQADCLDEHAGKALAVLLRTVEDVAADGPTEEELATHRERVQQAFADPSPAEDAQTAADDELLGEPEPRVRERAKAALLEVDGAGVRAAVRTFAQTAIVVAPEGTARPAGRMVDWHDWQRPAVEGRRHKRRRLAPRDEPKADLVVGEQGVSMLFDDGALTVPFDRAVAVVRRAWGALTVIGDDDTSVTVDPDGRADGEEAVAAVLAAVPEALVVPGWDLPAGEVVQRLAEDLEDAWAVRAPLRLLPQVLGREEHLEVLAQSPTRSANGVLAVTADRLLHVLDDVDDPVAADVPWGAVAAVEPGSRVLPGRLKVVLRDGGEELVVRVEQRERFERVLAYAQERVATVAGDGPGDADEDGRRLF